MILYLFIFIDAYYYTYFGEDTEEQQHSSPESVSVESMPGFSKLPKYDTIYIYIPVVLILSVKWPSTYNHSFSL